MLKQINENYSVDDEGNVYSRPRKGTKGGALKHIINAQGYPVVMLAPNRTPQRVHRLVAEAFLPNPQNKPFINHIDGNKENCNLSNLEWCTAKENAVHAVLIGIGARLRYGEDNYAAKLTEEKVKEIRRRYVPRSRLNGARALGREMGVAKSTILRIVNRVDWSNVI